MQGIIASQTITVLVGCFGTTIRFLSMAKHLQPHQLTIFYGKLLCPHWFGVDILPLVLYPLEIVDQLLCVIIHLLIFLCRTPCLSWVALKFFCTKFTEFVEGASFNFCDEPKDGFEIEDMTKECKALISRFGGELDDWALKKGVKDMRRLMIMNTSKLPVHLIQLLHKTPPSPDSLSTLLQNRCFRGSEECQICPVTILVLAKITTLSIPPSMSQCIHDSFKEFLEAIQYIDKKEGSKYDFFHDTNDFEDVWGDLYFRFLGNKPSHEEDFQSQMQLDQALWIIRDVKRKSENASHVSVMEGIDMISEFIETKSYASIEDLYRGMEQLFVDMIREMLIQLTDVVLKEIVKSSCEELEEKVKEALKLVSKFEQLKNLDSWSFLVGTPSTTNSATEDYVSETYANIHRIPDTENQSSMLFEGTNCNSSHALGVFLEGDHESHHVVLDEIIQIE